MAVTMTDKKVNQLMKNFATYIKSLQTNRMDPDSIKDAKNIANEIRPYLSQYPTLAGAVKQFDQLVKDTAPVYRSLSKYQRPGETVDAQGNVTKNIYQQMAEAGTPIRSSQSAQSSSTQFSGMPSGVQTMSASIRPSPGTPTVTYDQLKASGLSDYAIQQKYGLQPGQIMNSVTGAVYAGSPTGQQSYQSSQIKISTGDAALDQIANTYLDEIWNNYQSFFSNLPGPLDPNDTKAMEAEVERVFGPSLAKMKQTAEEYYTQQLNTSKQNRALTEEGLTNTLNRGQQDLTTTQQRLGEDVATQKRVLGRNYQEAQKDTALSYANAGRAMSGRRLEAEQKLGTLQNEDLTALDLNTARQQQDLLRNQGRLGEDVGIQRRGLDVQQQALENSIGNQRKTVDQQIADFKAQTLAQRMQGKQDLLYQTLPSLLSLPSFARVGTTAQTPSVQQYSSSPSATSSTGFPSVYQSPTTSGGAWARATQTAANAGQRKLTSTAPVAPVANVPQQTSSVPKSSTPIRSLNTQKASSVTIPKDIAGTDAAKIYLARLKAKGLIK